jgi:blue copper oxidase
MSTNLGLHDPDRLSRRGFMRLASVSVGAFAASGVLAACERASVLEPHSAELLFNKKGGGGGGKTVVRNLLRIPQEVRSPNRYAFNARPEQLDLGRGSTSEVWAYNGMVPGPTLRATRGETVSMVLRNGLAEDTTIHWHGMEVPTEMDGQPHDAVRPSGEYTYQYPINQRATMNWYHPHPHERVGIQVYMGLAGFFIIDGGEEIGLGLPAGKYEVPLVISDVSFDSKGELRYGNKSSGFLGNEPIVNGTLNAYHPVDKALYRIRILNGATARVFRLALSNGANFTLIGNDGGLLASAVSPQEVTLGPAERVDLIVDLRELNKDASAMLRCLDAGWDLLELRGTGTAGPTGAIPTTLSTITPLSRNGNGNGNPDRTFSFDGMSRINGKRYNMHHVDFRVPFEKTELWRFVTGGNAPHPVHIHGAYFQVQSRSGGRGDVVFPWEHGWKDTVLLQNGETVDVLIRFTAYKGRYLLHCHQLQHEDSGMMMNFEVV